MDSPRSPEKADETTSCRPGGHTLTAGAPSLTCNGSNPSGLRLTRGYGVRLQATPAPTSAPPPAAAAIPTSFAAGRYHVRRCLGEGSKERVYLAHDIRLDRDVAIALIETTSLDQPDPACLWPEAQATGRLGAHPHIVNVYNISEEDGQPYFASESMKVVPLMISLRLLAKALEERLRSAAAVREALIAISSTLSTTGQRMVQQDVNHLDQLVVGFFGGCEREMSELRVGLEDTLSGHDRLFMLVGKPGIGQDQDGQ